MTLLLVNAFTMVSGSLIRCFWNTIYHRSCLSIFYWSRHVWWSVKGISGMYCMPFYCWLIFVIFVGVWLCLSCICVVHSIVLIQLNFFLSLLTACEKCLKETARQSMYTQEEGIDIAYCNWENKSTTGPLRLYLEIATPLRQWRKVWRYGLLDGLGQIVSED